MCGCSSFVGLGAVTSSVVAGSCILKYCVFGYGSSCVAGSCILKFCVVGSSFVGGPCILKYSVFGSGSSCVAGSCILKYCVVGSSFVGCFLQYLMCRRFNICGVWFVLSAPVAVSIVWVLIVSSFSSKIGVVPLVVLGLVYYNIRCWCLVLVFRPLTRYIRRRILRPFLNIIS